MKVTDLMMGDWVQHNGKPKTIDVIWPFSVSLYDHTKTWGSIYADKFSVEEIEPIPLTANILVDSFEFVESRPEYMNSTLEVHSWDLLNDCGDVLVQLFRIGNGFVTDLTNGMTLGFQYVHQLQHLLKLMGINKQIILKQPE